MLNAVRLAVSLLLVPRLFASLILFPLLLSLVVVYVQLVGTGLVIQATESSPEGVSRNFRRAKNQNIGRRLLYGDGAPLATLKICRWVEKSVDGKTYEVPPSDECSPDRLDIAMQVSDPASYDIGEYRAIFEGNVERVHLCKTCQPDVVIKPEGERPRSDVYSVWGGLILNLTRFNDEVQERYHEAASDLQRVKGMLGDVYFHSEGMKQPTLINSMKNNMLVVLNIASLIVISLWLALKAHRKVLDYFARSGALLPMVAATGKNTFYAAIWLLTFVRVGAFLVTAVPITYRVLGELMEGNELSLFNGSTPSFLLWVLAIGASLSLATLIASISDLKHRHNLLSFSYKYVPIVIAIVGAAFWAFSFILQGSDAAVMRSIVASLPILGMTPVILAPAFEPNEHVLVIHTLLTVLLLVVALKHNAHWFAAHLEEL